jgi:hypothetical protein
MMQGIRMKEIARGRFSSRRSLIDVLRCACVCRHRSLDVRGQQLPATNCAIHHTRGAAPLFYSRPFLRSSWAIRHLLMIVLGAGLMFPAIIANGAGQMMWSIHLHRSATGFLPAADYFASGFTNKDQAIAQLRQLDPNGNYTGASRF